MELRTPPLSEFDFSPTSAVLGIEEYEEDIDDCNYSVVRNCGVVSPDVSVGAGTVCDRFAFSAGPSISIDGEGYWAALENVSNVPVTVTSPCLRRSVTIPAANYTRTGNYYLPGTLGRHVADRIEELLDGLEASDTTKKVFTIINNETGDYTWNHSCWAWPVDLTCMSGWNSRWHNMLPIMMITPRHFICGHWLPVVGDTHKFFQRDNTPISRTIASMVLISDAGFVLTDPATLYCVGKLNADLPPTITPAKLFPTDLSSYLPQLFNSSDAVPLKTITHDQEDKMLVNRVTSFTIPYNTTVQVMQEISSEDPFFEAQIPGDSSSPIFWPVNNQPVLLSGRWRGYESPAYHLWIDSIRACIDILEGGPSECYPEIVDLSGFTSF